MMLFQNPSKLISLLDRLFLCVEDIQSSWSVHLSVLSMLIPEYRENGLNMDALTAVLKSRMNVITKESDIQNISFINHDLNIHFFIRYSFIIQKECE